MELNSLTEKLIGFLKEINTLIVLKGLAGLAFTSIAYFTAKIYIIRRRYRHIPGPPMPKGILGFYLGVSKNDLKKYIHVNEAFLEWHETYGEVVKFCFLNQVWISTINKNAIKEILITKNFPKPEQLIKMVGFPLNERFTGYGLANEPNYEVWKHRRHIFNHGFHRNVLMTFVDQFNIKADMLTDRLKGLADGKTIVDLSTEFNHAALDAIAQIAFGLNTDTVNQKNLELNTAITKILEIFQVYVADLLFFRFRPSNRGLVRDFKSSLRFLRGVGESIIDERLKSIQNNEHIPTDILTNILKGAKEEKLDKQVLIDDFMTFFFAGQETTANALAFVFYELGRQPHIFKKAREEIDKVLGEKTEITYQDATDLKYCSAIFKEALRLYPPASRFARISPEDFFINDLKIPKGTTILISPYASGRTEKFFPNPLEFNPDRFLKDNDSQNSNIENYTYFPFSLGPRNCIGQNFAQVEGVILTAKIVQQFDIELDPSHKFEVTEEGTLKPKGGTRCTLKIRS